MNGKWGLAGIAGIGAARSPRRRIDSPGDRWARQTASSPTNLHSENASLRELSHETHSWNEVHYTYPGDLRLCPGRGPETRARDRLSPTASGLTDHGPLSRSCQLPV